MQKFDAATAPTNGIIADPDFLSALAMNGVSDAVVNALQHAMAHSGVDVQARAYARGMAVSFEEFHLRGVRHQVLYMVTNMGRWQGADAREAKKILRAWACKN